MMFNVFISAIINPNWKDDVFFSLGILWKGMLAILIVIGVIIAATYILQGISQKAQARKKAKLEAKAKAEAEAQANNDNNA